RIPLTIAFVFWSIVAAGTAGANSLVQLMALRLALGFGEAVVWPAGLSWIRAHIPEHERGVATGIFVSGSKWGPALAGLLAPRLITRYGWREMFLILGVGGAFWIVPWLLVSKERISERRERTEAAPTNGVPVVALLQTRQMWGTLIGT